MMISRKNIGKKPTRVLQEQHLLKVEASEHGLAAAPFIQTAIEAYSEKSQHTLGQLRTLLQKCGLQIKDTELDSLLPFRATRFNFKIFLDVAKHIRDSTESDEMDEILNAFVALGGSVDRTGKISKSFLVSIIKQQFELTFGIEDLLDNTNDSDSLDYEAFSSIFVQALEQSQSRRGSIFTNYEKASICVGNEGATERIGYNQFEVWLAQNYN